MLMRSTKPAPPQNENACQVIRRWGTLFCQPVALSKTWDSETSINQKRAARAALQQNI